MKRKAKNKKKQKNSKNALSYIKSIEKQKKSFTIADHIEKHICDIGIASLGKDGKIRASRALLEGYIPGWHYDSTEQIAYRIEDGSTLRFELVFDKLVFQKEVPEKYLTIQNLQRQTKLYLEEKNMPMFEQAWAKLKKIQPSNREADICSDQGCYQYSLENFNAAMEKFNVANFLNPYHALAYHNRGVFYSKIEKNYEKALENFNISIDINPGDSDTYIERGMTFFNYGKISHAIHDFEKAIILNPSSNNAYLNLGAALSMTGDYQNAIQNLNKAIELKSNDADAYFNRAYAYLHLKYYQQALNDYNKSANLYKQQDKISDFQDSLNRISEIKKIQKFE
ncbi:MULTISPECIES: tetratricopeptide repeat protein [Cyanophyceae]|uniref:tetratricopeptide repeat protein n=1 Tax=Cyanophyceae TaxID=3028117 RepID=UPI00016DCE3D|nr:MULTISPECIES: tetratricopeptide repeat protein [Cyanophyceae]ACB00910.1 Tetratricopeptide repeat (TPR) family protein [Picosynechococcus sp. PCC 7002]SMH58000.1 TPR repeat-containing protein [Picosynechococcus sp. OG1]SMQ86491.1 TPR repeat-containing protein [Synechococcus sp. 7002]